MKLTTMLLATGYLALMTGSVAFAQQPTEWRPTIAEDNKAATIEDTSEFLVTSLKNFGFYKPLAADIASCQLTFTYASARPSIGVHFEAGNGGIASLYPNSPADIAGLKQGDVIIAMNDQPIKDATALVAAMSKTKSGEQVRIDYERGGKKKTKYIHTIQSTEIDTSLFDLRRIDPLSIAVKRIAQGPAWLEFGGTNNADVGINTSLWRFGVDQDQLKTNPALFQLCKPAEDHCQVSKVPLLNPRHAFAFTDYDVAKRFARALMHAALLCGGTKAVSPF